MNVNARERNIAQLISPTVTELGCQLWGIEIHTGGKHTKLCIYIDRPDRVSVDDCERVSRAVSDLLDVEDVMPEHFTLEVSSPGMDRILFQPEHYAGAVGERIDVRLNVPLEKRKRIQGVLVAVEDNEAVLREDAGAQEEFVLPIESIARARVVPDFGRIAAGKPKPKSGKGKRAGRA
ncbi:MAG: ribosome maturation factor RimP [Pseudomonadota bacterium]